MAFSMNNMSSTFSGNSGGVTIHQGDDVPEIAEILTPQIGFKGLNRDKKARILREPWPDHDLPPPYASLLSIASARGLYAAASPNALVIGRMENVRTQIYSRDESKDIVDCEPLQIFPHHRLAHVAFASDEACLVVAEQSSSQITAYDVKALMSGNQRLHITLSTNAPVRTVAPNPDPSQANLFAILNTNGQLLLANLQGNPELVSGTNGPVLAENVSCMAWSTKGKQILAGKADGTAVQIKPDGTVVATIPKPESVPQDCHLAQIVWTETDVFISIYTPSSVPEDENPESHYFVVKTNKTRDEFTFHKTGADIIFAMVPRTPAYFHTARLRQYGPNLDELICITATVSSDIKMFTKSKRPLDKDTEETSAQDISVEERDAYSVTTPENESLQAMMPMREDASGDTTAIGMAIDLSGTDPIVQPILNEATPAQSEGPLPLLVALNDEGILRVWALVYNEAVRNQIPYSGFADVKRVREAIGTAPEGEEEMDTAAPQPSSAQIQPAPTANTPASAFSSASPFNQQTSSFPSPIVSTGGGFSKPTPIGGETKSSWTSTGFNSNTKSSTGGFGTAGFGAPGFGTTPALGSNSAPAFGKLGAMGSASQQSTASPAFGKAGFGTTPGQSSPFASAGNSSSSPFASAGSKPSSGFSSFATQGGFGAAKPDSQGANSFTNFSSGGGFSSASATGSSFFGSSSSRPSNTFGQTSSTATFGKPSPISSGIGGSTAPTTSPFGVAGQSVFKLDSTFQKDHTSKEEDGKPDDSSFGFGGFGNTMGGGAKKSLQAEDKETEMEEDEVVQVELPKEPLKKPQETPPSTLSQPRPTTTPHVSSLFGNQQQQSTTPPTQQKSSTGWGFGNIPSTTPKDTPAPTKFIFGTQPVTNTTPALVAQSIPNKPFAPTPIAPRDREQAASGKTDNVTPSSTNVPEPPLPPDPFSKPGYQTGDTSASSINSKTSREADDAPLPPDFVPAGKSAVQSIRTEDSELPPASSSSEFGESGDDLTGDVSGAEDHESGQSEGEEEEEAEHVQTSPESSFGHGADQSPVASPTGGPFTKVSKVEPPKQAKPLFGELGKPGPIFAPPKPQAHQIPRSPSPVRNNSSGDLFRPSERSVSAPTGPKSVLQQKKLEYQQSPFAIQAGKARDEEKAKETALMEAARRAREEAEAREKEPLVDDEDATVRRELAMEPKPNANLDPFMTIQPVKALQELSGARTDIHSQIEILYEDINSMVNTLGINARSLKEYMMYQKIGEGEASWPSVLSSDMPMDAVSNELFLSNINGLPAGCSILEDALDGLQVKDMVGKLDQCQDLLTQELTDLRARITAMRRSSQARAQADNNKQAPLSAEQLSVQQDLRKSSAAVVGDLAQIEDNLVVLRAKLADLAPSSSAEKSSMFGLGSTSQKKPSVEAVTNTVAKMTAMAEKKSADVDVLEAQLRKLNVNNKEIERPRTPERRISRRAPTTPGSGTSSVYLTPESREARSVRGTPSRNQQIVVSTEDQDRWQAKTRRRKEMAESLRAVLRAKHGVAA